LSQAFDIRLWHKAVPLQADVDDDASLVDLDNHAFAELTPAWALIVI
jgi:hypothetical protein